MSKPQRISPPLVNLTTFCTCASSQLYSLLLVPLLLLASSLVAGADQSCSLSSSRVWRLRAGGVAWQIGDWHSRVRGHTSFHVPFRRGVHRIASIRTRLGVMGERAVVAGKLALNIFPGWRPGRRSWSPVRYHVALSRHLYYSTVIYASYTPTHLSSLPGAISLFSPKDFHRFFSH